MAEITRRDFFTGAGALGAVTAVGTIGGINVVKVADASPAASAAGDGETAAAAIPTEVPTDATLELDMDYDAAKKPNGFTDPVRLITDIPAEELDRLLQEESEVTEDYTTPSGKVIPALYVRVRNRFNRLGIGMGSLADEETGWDTIMDNFGEDEAEVYLKAPLFGWFSAADYANQNRADKDEAAQMLDKLASHSIIISTTRGGVKYYALMAPLWGMWEMNMDKFDEDWCTTFNSSLGADFPLAATNCVRPVCHIVPVSPDVVDGDMAPYTNWRDTINNAEKFALSPCQCRLERDVLGTATCTPEEHDRESCISMGEAAEYFIERGIGREITKEEALEKVEGNVKKGMVVEQLFSKKCEVLCQCHSDCCKLLSTYYALGGTGNMMQNISFYELQYDVDTCIKCGACVDQCPMKAITLDPDKGCAMAPQCVRCGQCATVCPVSARSLKAKDTTLELPDDMIDDYHEYSRLRMAEGYIQDFVPGKNA
jgi:NAD-dependent dihydropyrimidine dehydrogenase PreA subunit